MSERIISINQYKASYMLTGTSAPDSAERFRRLQLLGIARFDALSIGDQDGQVAIVPLDESSKENAERLVAAWNSYASNKAEIRELVEGLRSAKAAIKGREHAGFIDDLIAKHKDLK